jgi:flagellar FliL protein
MGSMTGNKKIDTIILGVSTLMTLAVLGTFVYTEIIYERPLPDGDDEKEKLLTNAKSGTETGHYKLEKMIINLNSAGSRLRFLDVEMHLVPFKEKYNDIFDQSKAFVSDSIIDIASNMKPEELNSIAGKILLEDRIKKRLNQYYEKKYVKGIFFSRFVVQ